VVSVVARFVILLLLACGPARAAMPEGGELVFDIVREGTKIGTHRFSFRRDGGRVDVAIDIDIKVKLLLLTVFAYHHNNRETWEDGRLVRLATRTNDDGETMQVDGQLTAAGFKVSGKAGEEVLAPPVVPTSYWRTADTVRARRMLNTQTGEVMNVTITPGTETRIRARGETIEARHYVISGDLQLELWYDTDDVLCGLRFRASDGSVIHYALRPPAETTARGG
jgi:hypothetical protein